AGSTNHHCDPDCSTRKKPVALKTSLPAFFVITGSVWRRQRSNAATSLVSATRSVISSSQMCPAELVVRLNITVRVVASWGRLSRSIKYSFHSSDSGIFLRNSTSNASPYFTDTPAVNGRSYSLISFDLYQKLNRYFLFPSTGTGRAVAILRGFLG